MKVIIAGTRDFNNYDMVKKAIKNSKFQISEVLSGGASGVDFLGERWAKENNIPCTVMEADWNRFGKAAGPFRNEQMGSQADALIAIWDGESPGTANMIHIAKAKGLKVFLVQVKREKLQDVAETPEDSE